MTEFDTIRMDYDKLVDVLYITINEPQPGYHEELSNEMLLCKAYKDDSVCGLTLLNFMFFDYPENILITIASILQCSIDKLVDAFYSLENDKITKRIMQLRSRL